MPSNCMFRGKWHSGEMVFGGNDICFYLDDVAENLSSSRSSR